MEMYSREQKGVERAGSPSRLKDSFTPLAERDQANVQTHWLQHGEREQKFPSPISPSARMAILSRHIEEISPCAEALEGMKGWGW
jgi:hypothetical protein